jgi:peptidyl-prolyl cis-trans isomerase D
MLHIMRRKLKSLKIILWIVIFGLTVGMLLMFVDVGGRNMGGVSGTSVASVDGEEIGVSPFRQEYYRMVERYRRQFGEGAEQYLKMMRIDEVTLEKMIKDIIVRREAKKMGFEVTQEEILDYLRKIPGLTEGGRFIGRARMEQIMRANNMTMEEFEFSVVNDLLNQKVRSTLTGGIRVSEQEIRDFFNESRQKATIEYVAFKTDDFAKDVPVVESELASFFEKNKEKYRAGEQRRIQFLMVPTSSLLSKVQVSEQEIQTALLNLGDQTEVRARHILFKVEDKTKESEIKAKASAVLEEAKKGVDFAELAKKHSQDTGSAVNGGDLGYFKSAQMVPEFSNVAFALAPGQISDLVQSQYGFHIIKVEDRKSPAAEQQRAQAQQGLQTQKAEALGLQMAEELAALIRSGQDIKKLASDKGLETSESGFFKIDGVIPGLGDVPGLQNSIFNLKNIGEIGSPAKATTGYIVPKWIEKKDSYLPALSEVRNAVQEDYKKEKSVQLAENKAKQFSLAVRGGETMAAAAKKFNLTVSKPAAFTRRALIDETLRTNEDVMKAVFSSKVGAASDPVKADTAFAVFQMLSIDSFDEALYAKEKSAVRRSLEDRRKATFYQAYLDGKEQILRNQKKVLVNQPLIDQIKG